MLLYFILVYSAFIYYNISILFHVIFISGLVIFTYLYEKNERELGAARLRNHYIKSKLYFKIQEVENSIAKKHGDEYQKIMEELLEEIEH
jgi:hypothetical protein